MKAFHLVVAVGAAAAAHAGPAAPEMKPSAGMEAVRSEPYCQPPGAGQWWAGNAATYYSTEMADDIPDVLTGQQISRVTFHVSEWECGPWWDPQGLVINFYDQACPPESSPSIQFEVPWSQLEVEVVHDDGGPPFWYVRKVTATLPELVTIHPGMSIGGASVNDWSFGEHGWVGLIMTADYDVTGCEFYIDCAFQGVPRWTPGSAAPWWAGIPHDLAYCLEFADPSPTVIAGPIVNPANGNQYYLLAPLPWTVSELEAQALGGHLVTINDQAENDWVWDTFQSVGHDPTDQGNLWIGYSDSQSEGVWVWASGEPTTFTNWSPGEPNNMNGEDYAHMVGSGFRNHAPGEWNDILDSGLGGGGLVDPPRGVVEVVAPISVTPLSWSSLKARYRNH